MGPTRVIVKVMSLVLPGAASRSSESQRGSKSLINHVAYRQKDTSHDLDERDGKRAQALYCSLINDRLEVSLEEGILNKFRETRFHSGPGYSNGQLDRRDR